MKKTSFENIFKNSYILNSLFPFFFFLFSISLLQLRVEQEEKKKQAAVEDLSLKPLTAEEQTKIQKVKKIN